MKNRILEKIKYELQFKNPQYYTRIKEKVTKTYLRRVLKRRALALPPISLNADNAALTLAILANKRNLFESIAAIYSFCFWYKNVHVDYHEDGTLSEDDILILEKKFPGIIVYRRAAQDQLTGDYLISQGLHSCAQLRNEFVLSLKLVDTVYNKRSKYLLLIDSDVLFFARPNEIIDIVENGTFKGCYNKDQSNYYCFSNEIMEKYLQTRVVDQFNSGVFLFDFDLDFLQFVEEILKNELVLPAPWHIEQTLFAMYVTHAGNFKELPESYDLASRRRNMGHPITSEHYVHNAGYNFHKDFIYKLYPMFKKANQESFEQH